MLNKPRKRLFRRHGKKRHSIQQEANHQTQKTVPKMGRQTNKKIKKMNGTSHMKGLAIVVALILICIYGSWSQGDKFEYRSWQDGSGWLPKKEDLKSIQANVTRLKQIAERERLQTQKQAAQKSRAYL